MRTNSHDIVPLPYLPEGGGFLRSSYTSEEPLCCYFDTRDHQDSDSMWGRGSWENKHWYSQWEQGENWQQRDHGWQPEERDQRERRPNEDPWVEADPWSRSAYPGGHPPERHEGAPDEGRGDDDEGEQDMRAWAGPWADEFASDDWDSTRHAVEHWLPPDPQKTKPKSKGTSKGTNKHG